MKNKKEKIIEINIVEEKDKYAWNWIKNKIKDKTKRKRKKYIKQEDKKWRVK